MDCSNLQVFLQQVANLQRLLIENLKVPRENNLRNLYLKLCKKYTEVLIKRRERSECERINRVKKAQFKERTIPKRRHNQRKNLMSIWSKSIKMKNTIKWQLQTAPRMTRLIKRRIGWQIYRLISSSLMKSKKSSWAQLIIVKQLEEDRLRSQKYKQKMRKGSWASKLRKRYIRACSLVNEIFITMLCRVKLWIKVLYGLNLIFCIILVVQSNHK